MPGDDNKAPEGFKEEAQPYSAPGEPVPPDDAAEFAAGFAEAVKAAVAEHRRAGRPVYGIDEAEKIVQS